MRGVVLTAKRLGLVLFVAVLAIPAFSQNLPVPAKTSVTCDAATLAAFGGCLNFQGKTFPGWQDAPVSTFTGRWFDSAIEKSWQGGYRTSRGMGVRSSGRRIYWVTLSAVMAYDPASFVSTLASQVQENKLIPAMQMGVSGTYRTEPQDLVLRPDRFFNPEGSGSWTTFILDGEQRVFDTDWDDRGYVYMACGPFGWGVVKDDYALGGGVMMSAFQHIEGGFDPLFVESIHAGSDYYAFVNAGSATTEIWTVTALPNAPVHTGDLTFQLRRGSIAKSSDGNTIAAIYTDGKLRLYSPSTFVRGGDPTPFKIIEPPAGSYFYSVTSDDHNNFFISSNGSSGVAISAIGQDATGSYVTKTSTGLGLTTSVRLQYGANFLTAIANESFGSNVRLYGVNSDLSVGELTDGTHFFANYYRTAGSPITDAVTFKSGTKTYLAVSTYALGDVYELRSNGNAVNLAVAPSSVVYGDPVTFSLSSSSVTKPTVNLAYGDGGSTSLAPRTVAPPDYDSVTYTYGVRGNPLAGNLPSRKFTAVATTGDPNVTATGDITVTAPQQIGFGVQNHPELLFLTPNATAAPTIVAGDQFIDVSSGTAASHTIDWKVTNATGTVLYQRNNPPSTAVPAVPTATADGSCGSYLLTYLAHYGPTGGDAPYYLGGGQSLPSYGYSEGYVVKPFGVTIQQDTTDTTGKTISASARFSSADVIGDTCQYHWYLYDDANKTVARQEDNNTQSCRLSAIPKFLIAAQNTVQGPMTVQLTVTATGTLSRSCQTASSTTVTMPYTATSACPTLQASNFSATYLGASSFCTSNTTAPCSAGENLYFRLNTSAGGSCTPYTITWNFGDGSPTVTQTTFGTDVNHPYQSSGQKSVSVTVTDGSGLSTGHSVTIPLTVPVGGGNGNGNGGGPTGCAPISSQNLQISYYSQSYSCTSNGGACKAGENVTFSVAPFGGYAMSCGPYSYTWNFGDGKGVQTSGGTGNPSGAITYSFAAQSQPYSVTVQVSDGASPAHTAVLTIPVTVASGTVNNNSCPPITSSNVQITYYSQSYSCTSNGGTCNAGEDITFKIAPINGYAMGCGPYSYTWNFDDGQGAKTTTAAFGEITYRFTGRAQPYAVSVQVTDSASPTPNVGTIAVVRPVTIAGGPSCAAPSASNLTINKPPCASTTNGCTEKDALAFSVTPTSAGFAFACGPYTYQWDFGDHKLVAGDATHSGLVTTALAAGKYDITVVVKDAVGQSVTLQTSGFNVGPALPFGTAPCGPTAVCVNNATDQRYKVSVTAKTPAGAAATGSAVGQKGPFGYFSFPTLAPPDDPQVFVKVLELTPGKPWVFYAGLTNLEYTINVQDTAPGGTFNKSYPVPAPPYGSQGSIGDYDVNGVKSSTCLPVSVQQQIAAIPGSCTSDTSSLCLLDRFRVSLQAVDNPARSNGLPKNAPGVTVPVNKIFGFFTVPGLSSPDDIQAFIKMVDATTFNGHFWVLLGGLTDMQLTFTVTDTKTGLQNIYTKPAASTCGWNDNLAF